MRDFCKKVFRDQKENIKESLREFNPSAQTNLTKQDQVQTQLLLRNGCLQKQIEATCIKISYSRHIKYNSKLNSSRNYSISKITCTFCILNNYITIHLRIKEEAQTSKTGYEDASLVFKYY